MTGLSFNSTIDKSKNEDKMTIATFTKLLAISIVAKSRLGCSISSISFSLFLILSVRSSLRFEGVSEKKAASEAEMKAEQKTKKAIIIKPMIT
jgi:hypothetical protein